MNISKYFQPGYRFLRRCASGECLGTAVLIHGWGMRGVSMGRLAEFLANAGYDVLNYDYPSSEKNIAGHAGKILELFRREKPEGRLFFVTHSMGGLILRRALAAMSEAECRRISGIVMLGPPNGGSPLAWIGRNPLVRAVNAPLGDMVPGCRELKIPAPAYLPPVAVIAGKYDEKVPFKSTGLPDGLPFVRTTVKSTHPGLRRPEHTGKEILDYFKEFTANDN